MVKLGVDFTSPDSYSRVLLNHILAKVADNKDTQRILAAMIKRVNKHQITGIPGIPWLPATLSGYVQSPQYNHP